MNELKEWPPALIVATVCLLGVVISLPIAIGYLFAPEWGWMVLTLELLIFGKQNFDIWTEEKAQMKERAK